MLSMKRVWALASALIASVVLSGCDECKTSIDCSTGQICQAGVCIPMDQIQTDGGGPISDLDGDGDFDGATDDDTDTDTNADTDSGGDNDPTISWIAIPGGQFLMGDPIDVTAQPEHLVVINYDFDITRTEITVAQYAACVSAGNCDEPNYPIDNPLFNDGEINWQIPGRGQYPINGVVWGQARAFCAWAGGRLPSESEWEYAARSSGLEKTYPWGETEPSCEVVTMTDSSGIGCGEYTTNRVCSAPLGNTAQGLCDMAGSVFEWIEDYWWQDYTGHPADGSAQIIPQNDGAVDRVIRGGGFHTAADLSQQFRTTYRLSWPQDGANHDNKGESDLGFRCARGNRQRAFEH